MKVRFPEETVKSRLQFQPCSDNREMMEDFEAMLGDETAAPPKKRGRPTKAEAAARLAAQEAAERAEKGRQEGFYSSMEGKRLIAAATTGRTVVDERDFHMPVSKAFFARVLRKDAMTIDRYLRPVKPVGYAGSGANKRALYDFTEALPYLLKPKMDLGTYLKTLNPTEMPASINKVFWEAERIKNKTLIETGEAWPTERVLDVLGQVFMMIKDRIPLITEHMRDEGLTDAQSAKLREMCDQFQKDLHEALIELPKQQRTPSRLVDIDIGDGVMPDLADE